MEVGYSSLTGGLREFCTHILAQLQGESGETCISLNAIKSFFLPTFCSYSPGPTRVHVVLLRTDCG